MPEKIRFGGGLTRNQALRLLRPKDDSVVPAAFILEAGGGVSYFIPRGPWTQTFHAVNGNRLVLSLLWETGSTPPAGASGVVYNPVVTPGGPGEIDLFEIAFDMSSLNDPLNPPTIFFYIIAEDPLTGHRSGIRFMC